jgi:hypothetical protein
MLEAKELPTRIANLDSALAEVKAKDLTHCVNEAERSSSEEIQAKCPK